MSDQAKQETAAPEGQEKPSGNSIVPWIAVGVISAGLGSAVPFLLAGQNSAGGDDTVDYATGDGVSNSGAVAAADGTARKARKKAFTLPKEEETVFIPFGETPAEQRIVVNLDEGRLTRFLSFSLTLQISKASEIEFKKKISARKILLRSWLLARVADLDIEHIRGAAGQNRLRREIREHFNSVLCPDGYDQIYDVLFEEFNVQ